MQEVRNNNQCLSKKQAKTFVLNDNCAIFLDHLEVVLNDRTKFKKILIESSTFEFDKNKIYFIIGDSGVGKTTLVSHFNGLLKSRYGNIFVDNLKIIGKKSKIKHFKKLCRTIGMVFQFPEYQLFKDNVIKDVMFGPRNLGIKKCKANKLAKKYLNQMGIGEQYYSRSPFELSGGQKRRVAIAGILAIEPSIIVFDEPTAGLDPDGVNEMLKYIKELKMNNKTVFVITHDMNHVLQMADKVILLKDKKIQAIADPYEVFMNNDLLNGTKIIKPNVIQFIDSLVSLNSKFKKLYEIKPTSIEELADCINMIIRGELNE